MLKEAEAKAAQREEAVAQQMSEHKAALAWATGELAHEAEALREGATRLTEMETASIEMLQKQEALRERTARKVRPQLHVVPDPPPQPRPQC